MAKLVKYFCLNQYSVGVCVLFCDLIDAHLLIRISIKKYLKQPHIKISVSK